MEKQNAHSDHAFEKNEGRFLPRCSIVAESNLCSVCWASFSFEVGWTSFVASVSRPLGSVVFKDVIQHRLRTKNFGDEVCFDVLCPGSCTLDYIYTGGWLEITEKLE